MSKNNNDPKTGAELISRFVSDYCFPEVFVVTGGACAFIMDAISQNSKILYRVFQHEQAAAMAADAVWRVNKKIGVTVATSGPGATNLITGIACSWFDSIPTLHITGQVNQNESSEKLRVNVRQAGFQETDIVSMVKSITKMAKKVRNTTELAEALIDSFNISQSDRPGPCLIDVPMDVQKEEIDLQLWQTVVLKMNQLMNQINTLRESNIEKEIENFINTKQKPVILLGAGLGLSGNFDQALKKINEYDIPFVTSWNSLSYLLEKQSPNYLGSIGVYGSRVANSILDLCDGLLVLGSRLDNRQRSGKPEIFAPKANKLVIDIDPEELKKYTNQNSYNCINIDLKLINFDNLSFEPVSPTWQKEIDGIKRNVTDGRDVAVKFDELSPYTVVDHIFDQIDKDFIVVSDCGANLCWVYQSYKPFGGLTFTAGGNSPMGYSLPASIGAHFADKNKQIICFIGDGGFQLNIQELQTISHYELPIQIIILNNEGFGIIKQFQDAYFDSRYVASGNGYSYPDFKEISKAYGISYLRIENEKDLKTLDMKKIPKQIIIDVLIPQNALITPKLEMGRSFSDQFPYLNP